MEVKTFTGRDEQEVKAKIQAYCESNRRILEKTESLLTESADSCSMRAVMRRKLLLG